MSYSEQEVFDDFKKNFLSRRPRRNRASAAIRGLVQEVHLQVSQLVSPIFVLEGENKKEQIASMPGIYRYSIDLLLEEIFELYQLGIRAFDLFCYIPAAKKDPLGTEAIRQQNLLQKALYRIRKEFPDICLMADIALDPFTDHGHDGVLNAKKEIDNDATLQILAQMSLLAAQAGADIVAPSDSMDGRVAYIRQQLDQAGYINVGIISYAVKYASALYGPFREALGSAPQFGDKKTYQYNPTNVREALLEARLDEEEGADMLMIKPASLYLDVIAKVRAQTNLPIAAYHVSGEYSMVMAAAKNGWLDADKVFEETLIAIKRAGADFIFTYAAKQIARRLNPS